MEDSKTIYDIIEYAGIPTNLWINDAIQEIPFGQDNTGYIMNPKIGRKIWNIVGDKVSSNEKCCPSNITGEKYITFRLDGKTFSGVTKRLKKLGVFSKGYSTEFATIMITVTKKLCDSFPRIIYAFTQSDEITLVMKCTTVIDGKYEPHVHDGRRDKLLTLAAGLASQCFDREVVKLIVSKGLPLDTINILPDMFFDCRMAQYDTLKDAFELVLWRAYDCSVNGVSSAVYMCGLDECKKISRTPTDTKLLYLYQNKMLPLDSHQAYGTLFHNKKEPTEVLNQMTKEIEIKEKWHITQINGPVIINVKNGLIIL